ncbi:phosphotransferase [uncultured Cohaesibacter sp.]|uniref:phosphotransferase n=1 Tax=uncultured Cohaesibacter sp. TaxID=1002546 RepID=UPI002AA7E53D|nr:phosphotransferase [uncultured Cohaesibacter sp.]
MRQLNVVIIEDKENLFDDQVRKYSKLFKYCSYEMVAFHATGQSSAQSIIRSKNGIDRIHLVVSDIHSVGPKRGLLWIQRLKEEFPDIVFIGNSRHDISYRETTILWPSFDVYIDKNILNRDDEEENRVFRSQILDAMKQDVEVFISKDSDLSNLRERDFKGGIEDRALNSLVAQVVFAKGEHDSVLHPTRVRLSPITGGFSGSYVFRMEIECPTSKLRTVPAVLKLSHNEDASIEAENYKKYVKWILPYKWRVDLLGEGKVKGWSAVCYSFAHGTGLKFDSVTNALKKGEVSAVEQVIDQIFSPNYQTWYSNRLCTDSGEKQISAHYSNEYFGRKALSSSKEDFLRLSQKYLGAVITERDRVSIKNIGISISEPSTVLFATGRGSYSETICHGDLNSNNVMIAKKELTFIDFQSTGRKHVFRDFLTFESSIRLYFPDNEIDPETLIRYEGIVSTQDAIEARLGDTSDLPEMFRLILRVRQAALKNFPNEPLNNYIYGMTVFSLRLLRVDDFSDIQYVRTLCQVFCGMSRLPQV